MYYPCSENKGADHAASGYGSFDIVSILFCLSVLIQIFLKMQVGQFVETQLYKKPHIRSSIKSSLYAA